MDFLETTEGVLLFSIVGLVITFWVLYEIIKAAVTAGMINANAKIEAAKHATKSNIPLAQWTPRQVELREKYNKGEITMEEYSREFHNN